MNYFSSRQLGVILLYSTSQSSQFLAPLECCHTDVDYNHVVWSKLSEAANREIVLYIMIFVCEIHILCRSFWLVLRILVVKPEFDGGSCLNLAITNFKWPSFLNSHSAPENNQPQVRKQESYASFLLPGQLLCRKSGGQKMENPGFFTAMNLTLKYNIIFHPVSLNKEATVHTASSS
jgi:hypothetical protein